MTKKDDYIKQLVNSDVNELEKEMKSVGKIERKKIKLTNNLFASYFAKYTKLNDNKRQHVNHIDISNFKKY